MSQPDLFAELERDEALAEPWAGAPLTYTDDYYTPIEFAEAIDRWILENGRFGIWPFSHMWHGDFVAQTPPVVYLAADARHKDKPWPDCKRHDSHDHMPNEYMHQANCAACRWHFVSDDVTKVKTAGTAHAYQQHGTIA